MNENELLVFVKVDLFLHEDGFTKLRELIPQIEPVPYSVIEETDDGDGNLIVKPIIGDLSNVYAIAHVLKDSHLLISLKNLKLLLSMD